MKGLACAVALLLLSCAAPVAPPPAGEPREIFIDAIAGSNPLVVKGRARTFENAVSLRLRDERGELISESHVTSVGDTGRHNPYEAQLWLVRDPGARVTVEAFEYSARDGSIRSLTSKTIAYAGERIRVTLTFPLAGCERFAAFERDIPKTAAMARLLVEALLAGPAPAEKAAGATSPFPAGTGVRSVVLRDGVLTVDFDHHLQHTGGACGEHAIRRSVTETLQRLPSVRRVVITVDGAAVALTEHR